MQQGIIEKNHMDILWHDYALNKEDTIPITKAGLIEKASVVGRCGMMLLSCGTGAWREKHFDVHGNEHNYIFMTEPQFWVNLNQFKHVNKDLNLSVGTE